MIMKYLRDYWSTALIVLIGGFLLYRLVVGSPHPLNGAQAPPFTLENLQGESVSLASHLGKDVVVLDFWATWCPPCRKGLPVLDRLSKTYAEKSVAIYAVNIREGDTLVSRFVEENKLSLGILLDTKGMVADDYGVSGIPQTVIIDRTGKIHAIHVGVSPFGFEASLASDIEEALAQATADE